MMPSARVSLQILATRFGGETVELNYESLFGFRVLLGNFWEKVAGGRLVGNVTSIDEWKCAGMCSRPVATLSARGRRSGKMVSVSLFGSIFAWIFGLALFYVPSLATHALGRPLAEKLFGNSFVLSVKVAWKQ